MGGISNLKAMATLNQISMDLINIVRGGLSSDDELISQRQIKFWIHNTRAQLITQEINKHRSISDNIIQDLGCINVSATDASLCCNVPVGCTITRTDVPIPNTIATSVRDLLTRVGPVDISAPSYTLVPYQRAAWIGRGRWTKKYHFAFLHKNYVYIVGPKSDFFKKVNIQGVFENPTDVKAFNTCTNMPCYSDDSEYPISVNHIETMKQIILKNNFKIEAVAPTDVAGDAKGNLEMAVQK